MADIKQCSKCGEWWLDGQAMPASTNACIHNWVLTSLDTVSPLSKQTRTNTKIRVRTSRQRAQVRNVIRGAVIIILVVFAAVVLVAAAKTGTM